MSSNSSYSSNVAVHSRKKPVAWEKDRVVPHNKSSVAVLIEGTKNNPVASKKVLVKKIAAKLAEAGITNRKEQDIQSKISSIQNDFSKAADWLSNTGNGVRVEKTNEGADTEDTERYIRVKKICEYYYDLEPYLAIAHPLGQHFRTGRMETMKLLENYFYRKQVMPRRVKKPAPRRQGLSKRHRKRARSVRLLRPLYSKLSGPTKRFTSSEKPKK
ncbi:hypothetical protein DFQ30_011036 [Apophysomyces sp. BC1015]|nr:hypothetical protein DFQ30_011036 [Apophysomyces sp. BC1015]